MAGKPNLKPLDELKKRVSAGSTAGKLRDGDKRIQDALKAAGAKAKTGRNTTRNA